MLKFKMADVYTYMVTAILLSFVYDTDPDRDTGGWFFFGDDVKLELVFQNKEDFYYTFFTD